jgi:uncharacterized cupredoxin-like copper-binding protein
MRRFLALALISLMGLVVYGGGGRADASNAPVKPGARKIKVAARNYEFDPNTIDVRAGENVAIVLHSEDQRHDFVVQGKKKGLVVEVNGGKTARGGLRLTKPGKYTFYCSIPGHRAAGMVGTISAS